MHAHHLGYTIRCWNCGKENDGVASEDGKSGLPQNGNVSVCCNCAALAIFDDSMPDKTRKPTPTENHELRNHEHIVRAQLAVHLFNEMHKRKEE